jgi:hypothetical protein
MLEELRRYIADEALLRGICDTLPEGILKYELVR